MRAWRLALAAALLPAAAPAGASAATVTVHADDGTEAVLAPAAAPTLRRLGTTVWARPTEAEGSQPGSWLLAVSGPDGAALASDHCRRRWATAWASVPYRGNGRYVARVTRFADTACTAQEGAPEALSYAVEGGTAPLDIPPRVLTGRFWIDRRGANLTDELFTLRLAAVPQGAKYEMAHARNATVNPDGSLAGAEIASVNVTVDGPKTEIDFREPGPYTLVTRAGADGFFTPWSPPVTLQVLDPFRAIVGVNNGRYVRGDTIRVRRGRWLRLTALTNRELAGRRVSLAIARGRKGGRFRTVARVRVGADGRVPRTVRFRRRGTYRVRLGSAGSDLVARGSATVFVVVPR